ncbi:MAG: VanZ family protein [Lachnospiraceae bacterium]|nr:VanZ family protein [Lachnospiraceae bacterium]
MTDNNTIYAGTGVATAVICFLIMFNAESLIWPLIFCALVIAVGTWAVIKAGDGLEGLFIFSAINFAYPGVRLLFDLSAKTTSGIIPSLNVLAVMLSWAIPFVWSVIYALSAHDVERNGFAVWFRSQSIMMGLGYIAFMIFWLFYYNTAYHEEGASSQLIPFATFAGYLEAVIMGNISWKVLALYFVFAGAIFIPFGFLVSIALSRFNVLVRLAVALFFPLLTELIQLWSGKNLFDIDDIIIGFVGGALGILIHNILDAVFLEICGRSCTGKPKRYSFE